jgi:uncharacterized repeat protein (TIGR01451 family)
MMHRTDTDFFAPFVSLYGDITSLMQNLPHNIRLISILFLLFIQASTAALAKPVVGDTGILITNRADATYADLLGNSFSVSSETITITVRTVSGINVTPDETEPSTTTHPFDNIIRTFRICNTGNSSDQFTITRVYIDSPATLTNLHLDTDFSGTLTDQDLPVIVGTSKTPMLDQGKCIAVIATIETNDIAQGSRLSIALSARSNLTGSAGGRVEDEGRIVNIVGKGAILTSPDDPSLQPLKLVEDKDRIAATTGQILNYSISFRNSGDFAARRVVVSDPLPLGLEYVNSSLKLNQKALSDADDTDEGKIIDNRISVHLNEVLPGATVKITFQARVTDRVPSGTGAINIAELSGENVKATNTTQTIVVVNPFGTVYEGRSNGAIKIAGADVTIFADPSGRSIVSLATDIGTNPNINNQNPFKTNPSGQFNFAFSPEQLGTEASPIRYYLNVAAQGFRGRMLEVALRPIGNGLFEATVRSLDGQPIARTGGFELTNESINIDDLGAFALNIPMFESSTIEISKSADKQHVQIGDVVSYRVEVHNASMVAVNDVTVLDQLPISFHYASSSARLTTGSNAYTSIEPKVNGSSMTFNIGTVGAGERIQLAYRVRIGVNAREGEQVNSAVASGLFSNNERVVTEPAKAAVNVGKGLFSTRQVLIGRVFEDTNGNGFYDGNERPVAGARIYLNNGHSVVTDSEGMYNLPSIGDGSAVISLDPITIPQGYALTDSNMKAGRSWTRLVRAPLLGGSLVQQNFALRPLKDGQLAKERSDKGQDQSTKSKMLPNEPTQLATVQPSLKNSQPLSAGTYEIVSTEIIETVAPGEVVVLSPVQNEVIAGASMEVEVRVAEGWSVELEVNNQKVSKDNIGTRREDRKNRITTYTFVGITPKPGPNQLRLKAISPEGSVGKSTELIAFGRGPAKRLEIIADKKELQAGGRDSTRVKVRAIDEWGNPAADGQVALEVSAGRLLPNDKHVGSGSGLALTGAGTTETGGITTEQVNENMHQQVITLINGEATARLIADNSTGVAEVRAKSGVIDVKELVRFTPETRPTILVGLAELSFGKAAPDFALNDESGKMRKQLSFFYRGSLFKKNLLTLAYDNRRSLNGSAGRDRMFQMDPLERVYPIFGDSSTRYEDAQSNSKLYARLDRGRSYFMFGDFEADAEQPSNETDTKYQSPSKREFENRGNVSLTNYSRKLTGVKIHVENSKNDFITITGARPDTAFGRDVFAGGALNLIKLNSLNIIPGSETLTLEVRDRRNPEVVISRENLVRSIDYNLNSTTGEIFFLRNISAFDYSLNLIQVVATYEYRAKGMSSAVYTARGSRRFDSLGLRLGFSAVNQRQAEFGSFLLSGINGSKDLPRGGKVHFEVARSTGQVATASNLVNSTEGKANGNAINIDLQQPLPFKEGLLRANFSRADAGFLNPFGATVTPGSQRTQVSLDMKVRKSSMMNFGILDERNKTENVDNNRLTTSLSWTERISDKLSATFAYDYRRLSDNVTGQDITSNLITVGAEWRPTDKLEIAAKREQNLGTADPTYPDQTTLSANYHLNDLTRIFFTQRFASAPITPISDTRATGFASTGSRNETAIGVETKVGRYTSLGGRYQIENGINGVDSFAVIGLGNRLPINKRLSLDLGLERGFHVAGEGQSFNSASLGLAWHPTENFRSSARYELRDRNGIGNILSFGAAGKLGNNLTALARFQYASAKVQERKNNLTNGMAAVAYRPLKADSVALLFSYTHSSMYQDGIKGLAGSRDRVDTLATDGLWSPKRNLELYGRFALSLRANGSADLAYVSTLTYLMQGRAQYRLGKYLDAAGEARMLYQPITGSRRLSYGTEAGFWALSDLRLGVGYNFTAATEPGDINFSGARKRGAYFTITSKLSNLFNLFGTSKEGIEAYTSGEPTNNSQATISKRSN